MTERIPPAAPSGRTAELLNGVRGAKALHDKDPSLPALNVMATLVRHPALFGPVVALAQRVTDGLLPARHRELVALRAAVHCRSAYVWAHHWHAAKAAGVSDDEIALITGPATGWADDVEQALIGCVDELHTGTTVSDPTWRVLSGRFGEAELIELLILVGEYRKIACFLNSVGTPVEDWLGVTPPLPRFPGGF